jgi:hypothetical protein
VAHASEFAHAGRRNAGALGDRIPGRGEVAR